MNDNLARKTKKAFKWSSITEIVTRVIQPVTNMILARILLPEAFGVLASILMVIAFAEVFVESGFQKFLIQHEFKDTKEESQYLSVAFWANLIFSLFVWAMIVLFRDSLADMVGNGKLEIPLSVTGIIVPLYGIVGIQNCRLRKSLEFKKLFWVRLSAALVPLVVTIPCAMLGLDYWALIIGNIAGALVRMIMLYIVDRFMPKLIFDRKKLFHMIKFGIWTLLDGLAVWATLWLDTLLISRNLSDYYLGLYKNSITTITEFIAIVTSAVTPVLFSSLSKVQDDQKEFNSLFLNVQKTLSIFLIPMGVGLWFYRDLATYILFGSQWTGAGDIIGIMSITIVIRTILISFYSDAYRAKGKFRIPLYLQLLDILILVPTCILSLKSGFWTLVYARAFVRLDLVIPEMIAVWYICRITPVETVKVLLHPLIATVAMTILILFLKGINQSIVWQFISIGFVAILYFVILFLFKDERKYLSLIISKIKKKASKDREYKNHE